MHVYLITNKVNGKMYVGQTICRPGGRWSNHKSYARAGKDSVLYRSMRKHGVENFEFQVLSSNLPDVMTMDAVEIFFIRAFNTLTENGQGYNVTEGGSDHFTMPEASRAKMRAAKVGKPAWNKGKSWSPETIEHMRAAQQNRPSRPCSDETKEKLRIANKGQVISAETRAKMSAARKGRAPWNKRSV